jgi:hypothetical protein
MSVRRRAGEAAGRVEGVDARVGCVGGGGGAHLEHPLRRRAAVAVAALRPADAVLVAVDARAGIDRVQGATVRRTRRRHGRAGRRTERGRTARRGRSVGGEAPSAVVDVAVQILHLLEEAHGVGRGGELVAQRPIQFGALAEDVQVCATAAADLDAQVHQRALQAAEPS